MPILSFDAYGSFCDIYGFSLHGLVFVEAQQGEEENVEMLDLQTGVVVHPGFNARRANFHIYDESAVALREW